MMSTFLIAGVDMNMEVSSNALASFVPAGFETPQVSKETSSDDLLLQVALRYRRDVNEKEAVDKNNVSVSSQLNWLRRICPPC
jgi:hypothetical protein